jgi:hypothetical protein
MSFVQAVACGEPRALAMVHSAAIPRTQHPAQPQPRRSPLSLGGAAAAANHEQSSTRTSWRPARTTRREQASATACSWRRGGPARHPQRFSSRRPGKAADPADVPPRHHMRHQVTSRRLATGPRVRQGYRAHHASAGRKDRGTMEQARCRPRCHSPRTGQSERLQRRGQTEAQLQIFGRETVDSCFRPCFRAFAVMWA